MITSLKNVLIEDQYDAVDYLTKGLPPRKDDAEKAIKAIVGHFSFDDIDCDEYGDFKLPKTIMSDDLEMMLRQVYQNNCRNTKVSIAAIIGGTLLGVLFGSFCINTPNKEEK